jgi:hypothetical protein
MVMHKLIINQRTAHAQALTQYLSNLVRREKQILIVSAPAVAPVGVFFGGTL